ncbi:hypothetical protein F5Y00DRAFT_262532 [Daldinia vernicosa]|uniref:uncharacterized protein n=1 Tax=Daldinia vernicosa TaxID=114800 RepID=UPI0020087896|nr:uncharacterized protein F5Y00DRAFT_262532 [Daldinia vernicosa]KAI0848438.1 hypothetical protein F5Y00DRAFT_262532 [Daldinia vernicosa]
MDSLSNLESQSGPYNAANTNHGANPSHITSSGIRDRAYAIVKKSLGGLFNSSTEDSQSDIPRYINKSSELIDDMSTNYMLIKRPSYLVTSYSQGCPRLAAIVASNRDYLIIRQFGYLHARVLLDLQDKLQGYEEDLEKCDGESHGEGANNMSSVRKTDLLRNIEETLRRYKIMLDYASSPHLQQDPSETDIKNLGALSEVHAPFANEKKKYYLYKEDLISLNSQEDTARVDGLLTKLIFYKPNKLIKKIFKHEESTHQNDPLFLSTGKFNTTIEIILVFTLIMVLIRNSLKMPGNRKPKAVHDGNAPPTTDRHSSPNPPYLGGEEHIKLSNVIRHATLYVKARMAYDERDGSFHWQIKLPNEENYRRFELEHVACLSMYEDA